MCIKNLANIAEKRTMDCKWINKDKNNEFTQDGQTNHCNWDRQRNDNDLVNVMENLQAEIKELVQQSKKNHQEVKTELVNLTSVIMCERQKVDQLQMENKLLKDRNSLCEGMILRQGREMDRIKEDILNMKCREMQDNVVLSGIPERENETEDELLDEVNGFLKTELKMEEDDIKHLTYDVIHRVGVKKPIGPNRRDVVIKFSQNRSKTSIMRHVRNLRRGTKYFVADQYPPEINERRRKLQKKYKQEKAEGKHVKLVADRLYVEGQLYQPEFPQHQNTDLISDAKSIEIVSSEKFTEKGSCFQGHVIKVTEQTDYRSALIQLFKDPIIAAASHNMWVFKSGSVYVREDDGEYGGSYRIEDMLNHNNAVNCMVVVT